MVKISHVFLGSLCVHSLLAFSLQQQSLPNPGKLQSVPVTLITLQSSKAAEEQKSIKTIKPTKKSVKVGFTEVKQNDTVVSDTIPIAIYNPAPNYPENAKIKGHEAEFFVTLTVNATGIVEQVKIETVRGNLEWFETDLIQTFKKWRFSENFKKTTFSMPISFLLDD